MARLWEWETGLLVCPGFEHKDEVRDTCFTPDQRWIFTLGADGTICAWESRTGKGIMPPLSVPGPFSPDIRNFMITSDGKYVAVPCTNGFDVCDITDTGLARFDKLDLVGLQLLAEIYSGRRIVASGTVKLTTNEWLERWRLLLSRPESVSVEAEWLLAPLGVSSRPAEQSGKKESGSDDKTPKVWDASSAQAQVEIWRGLGALCATQGNLEQAIADYSAVLRLHPDDQPALVARGKLYGRVGRWQEALADLDRAIALDPSDHWIWFIAGPLRLRLGDTAGHRKFCRDFSARFRETDNPLIAERIAKICLLVPDAVEDRKMPARLAQQAVMASTHPELAWFQLAKGMADYREGQFASAIQWLRESHAAAGGLGELQATDNLFLAMAHYRLGETDQARKSLAEARRTLETLPPANGASDWGDFWNDLLMCRIVQAEAESLLAPSGISLPPAEHSGKKEK